MDDAFDKLMRDLEQLVEDPPFAAAAGEVRQAVADQVEQSFEQRRSPDGEPWPPLKGPSKSRGVLQRQAVGNVLAGTVNANGFRPLPMQGDVWRAQNDGDPRLGLPPRPFWGIGRATIVKVTDILLNACVRALGSR